MADILNDHPSDYAADLQIQDQDPNADVDGESGNEFRAALRRLNALANGFAGLPGFVLRSVLEFGAVGDAVGDGGTDDYQAFQDALDWFEATGGAGTLLIPPRRYRIDVPNGLPLTIPRSVHVKGAGQENTVLVLHIEPPPDEGDPLTPGIRFVIGPNYGRISELLLLGRNAASSTGIGLSFAGSQFNVAAHLQIWDFAIGVDMSDGTSVYSAHNELSNFLVSRCPLGIRCHRHGNGNWIERGRVFWSFGPPEQPGTGVGIDVDAAQALSIRSVTVESANTCLRFRATADPNPEVLAAAWATCEVSSCYFEHGPAPPADGEELPPGPYRIFDISYPASDLDPGGVTYLRLGANRYEGDIGRLDVPPEALADLGAVSESPFGAHTHFAAHAHRQCSENHDLRMYAPAFIPGGWDVHNSAVLAEETTDFFSSGRTLQVTRTAGAGDGIRKRIEVPEDVDWVTVGFRYKNISSTSINYFARSGAISVNGADAEAAGGEPAGAGYRERWLQLPKDRATDELIATIEVDHGLLDDTSILVDAIWCVPGRVRTSDFRYEQRVHYLERAQLILQRTGVVANEIWSVDWATLTGLAAAPRGTVGAILAVHLTATESDDGNLIPQPIWVTVAATAGATVYAERDGRASTRQLAVRRPQSIEPTTIRGAFRTEVGASFPTDYQIYVVGWILG